MRTNILLDDDLLEEALKLEKIKSKKEPVHHALKEFVESKKNYP